MPVVEKVLVNKPAANVRFWHKADIDADDEHVCFGVKRTSLIG